MRLANLKVVFIAAAALFAVGLMVPADRIQADTHHNGHGKLSGKGDGKHHFHTTGHGHKAYGHMNNGRVKTVSVHHNDKQLNVKKVRSKKKLHALLDNSNGSQFAFGDGSDVVSVLGGGTGLADESANELASAQGFFWVGFAFYNTFNNQWIIFWFPVNFVDGGDSGAETVDDNG